jgi:hypothetical protein
LKHDSLINDCYKYITDLTTNGAVIPDAIKFVQTKKEKISMSTKEDKESKEPDRYEDKDQVGEKQEEETGEHKEETTNQVF